LRKASDLIKEARTEIPLPPPPGPPFHRFADLPFELRRQIWRYLLPAPEPRIFWLGWQARPWPPVEEKTEWRFWRACTVPEVVERPTGVMYRLPCYNLNPESEYALDLRVFLPGHGDNDILHSLKPLEKTCPESHAIAAEVYPWYRRLSDAQACADAIHPWQAPLVNAPFNPKVDTLYVRDWDSLSRVHGIEVHVSMNQYPRNEPGTADAQIRAVLQETRHLALDACVFGDAFHGVEAHDYYDGFMNPPTHNYTPGPEFWTNRVRACTRTTLDKWLASMPLLETVKIVMHGTSCQMYGENGGGYRGSGYRGCVLALPEKARVEREREDGYLTEPERLAHAVAVVERAQRREGCRTELGDEEYTVEEVERADYGVKFVAGLEKSLRPWRKPLRIEITAVKYPEGEQSYPGGEESDPDDEESYTNSEWC
jgi:hypothetical protein